MADLVSGNLKEEKISLDLSGALRWPLSIRRVTRCIETSGKPVRRRRVCVESCTLGGNQAQTGWRPLEG